MSQYTFGRLTLLGITTVLFVAGSILSITSYQALFDVSVQVIP
jgi:hypothetical protein